MKPFGCRVNITADDDSHETRRHRLVRSGLRWLFRQGRSSGAIWAGHPLSVIVSELGAQYTHRPYSDELRGVDFCPAETVRLVDYLGPRVPFLIHGAATTLCVDKSNRVLKVLFSDS